MQAMGAPNLTDKVWLYGSSEATIVETVTKGRNGMMPAHEAIFRNQIDLLGASNRHQLPHREDFRTLVGRALGYRTQIASHLSGVPLGEAHIQAFQGPFAPLPVRNDICPCLHSGVCPSTTCGFAGAGVNPPDDTGAAERAPEKDWLTLPMRAEKSCAAVSSASSSSLFAA